MNLSRFVDHSLVLSRHAVIMPVAQLHRQIRNRLSPKRTDCIVSLRNSRLTSQRVSEEAAVFLEHFRSPCKLIDAVIEHARNRRQEPTELLSEVYPFVASLLESGILLQPESSPTGVDGARYAIGDTVNDLTIVSCVQHLGDSSVFLATNRRGKKFALKCVSDHAPVYLRAALMTERRILTELGKTRRRLAPALHAACLDRPDPFLAVEWLDGATLFDLISATELPLPDRKQIATNLLNAYQDLHAAGVIHGDVHPKNVIVGRHLGLRLIDFGGAISLATTPGSYGTYERAAVVSHFEPELARTALANETPPPPTAAGEQHNVAVLLFLVLTGNMYLPLSLETHVALEQIVNEPPRSLSEFGLDCPSLDRVIRRALSKNPTQRYASMTAFTAEALKHLQALTKLKKRAHIGRTSTRRTPSSATLASFREVYGLNGTLLREGWAEGPTVPLFHGAAGLAYAFLRISRIFGDPLALAEADAWIERARAHEQRPEAFENPAIDHLSADLGRHSLFHSSLGLSLVEALVRFASCDTPGFHLAGQSFTATATACARIRRQNADRRFVADVTQGPGSVLLGALQLLMLPSDATGPFRRSLKRAAATIADRLLRETRASLTNLASTGASYWGFAHGYAGVLYAIVQGSWLLDPKGLKSLKEALSVVEAAGKRSGRALCWPLSTDTEDRRYWIGWCHGSAGHILLWLAAAKAFRSRHYIRVAEDVGEHAWRHRDDAPLNLCCGLTGVSLAFLLLGAASGRGIWRDRGLKLANEAFRKPSDFTLPHSLFQGKVGLGLLAAELNASEPRWPILQSPL